MQLKELTLKELLALFDASAHGQISEYFDDPEIHYIVVFANHFQPDMGLLTVGPNQDCTSLEQAKRAIIDRKFAKFMVRCRHCPMEQKKAETVVGLVRPMERGAHLEPVRASGTVPPVAVSSGRAQAPEAATPRVVFSPGGAAVSAQPFVAKEAAVVPAVAQAPLTPEREAELSKREAEVIRKEAALKAVEADLKQREDELMEREDYVTQSEESLIDKIQKQERRGAELEQQEENIRKGLDELARKEAAFAAKVEALKVAPPGVAIS